MPMVMDIQLIPQWLLAIHRQEVHTEEEIHCRVGEQGILILMMVMLP
jgi:hypothetical protein